MNQPVCTPRLHHIGVQTDDLRNCVSWYEDFFSCRVQWSTDMFSPLTHSRLPGITRLTEVAVDGTRFHLFERPVTGSRSAAGPGSGGGDSGGSDGGFQHVCLAAGSVAELTTWRDRWIELYNSGRYAFARRDLPTEIVTDAQGTASFYCFDVNGLEFEFTYLTAGAS